MTRPCVVWDWNGTLLNDVEVSFGIFNEMLHAHRGETISIDRFREIYTHPIVRMYESVGFTFNESYSFEHLSVDWYEIYRERVRDSSLFADAHDVVRAFSSLQLRQVVISALEHAALNEHIRFHALDSYFDLVSGHHDLQAHSKVERALAVITGSGISPRQTIVVGDTSHDAEVARAVGTACVLVCRGYEPKKKLESHGFPVVDSLHGAVSEVREWLSIIERSPFESSSPRSDRSS